MGKTWHPCLWQVIHNATPQPLPYKDLCDRNRHQGHGQVITSHRHCGMKLPALSLDMCFWDTHSHMVVGKAIYISIYHTAALICSSFPISNSHKIKWVMTKSHKRVCVVFKSDKYSYFINALQIINLTYASVLVVTISFRFQLDVYNSALSFDHTCAICWQTFVMELKSWYIEKQLFPICATTIAKGLICIV